MTAAVYELEPGKGIGLVVTTADLSKSAPPRWAWEYRFVRGYLNLLIGNEGVGKGTLMAELIAWWTKGALPGDLQGQPVSVGILGDEDSFQDVWTPRLHAAGADLSRVFQIERPDGGYVDLREDREKLGQVVIQRDLSILFFDQLLDNLGVGVDDWRQKAVREALQPIRALAREFDLLALGALHPNKRADSFRQLVSGAASFNAVSRSSMLLAQHPDDDERRVLCRGKGNLSKAPDSIEFQIVEKRFTANGHDFRVPAVSGFTTGTLTVDDLIGNETVREDHSKVATACEVIEALLPHDGEWHAAKPIKEAAAADGIDDRTAQRAMKRLGIEHRRPPVFQAGTEWRWPTRDAHTTSAGSVASVATVASKNAPKPLLSGSYDTHDRYDTADTSRDSDATGSER